MAEETLKDFLPPKSDPKDAEELALELKHATYVARTTVQGVFFIRLLEGLIRKVWGS